MTFALILTLIVTLILTLIVTVILTLILTLILPLTWILTWIGGTPATVLVSSALLFGLVGTNLAILSRGGAWQSEPPRQWADTLLFDIPFSIYTGWVTVASIVNVAAAASST